MTHALLVRRKYLTINENTVIIKLYESLVVALARLECASIIWSPIYVYLSSLRRFKPYMLEVED